ncbi:MAG: carbohydrate ABC transporter permease [Candidatus Sumerlaeota bacterium]|nr:carbohydrate ABC transporter permease [Candidatus Sumerlaeota bacterium]
MLKKRLKSAAAHAALLLAAFVVLGPLLWMIASAFKPGPEIIATPHTIIEARRGDPDGYPNLLRLIGDLLWPDQPTLRNFRRILNGREIPFGRYYLNSVFISSATTALTLFFCSLAGFGFAKYRFWGRNLLFAIVLASLMIPHHVLMIPLFSIFHSIGWINSYKALIIPGAASAFGIFLVRQYCQNVPDQMVDAARIDGCGEFRIYWEIILPVIKPVLGALTIFVFMGSWNAYVWPLIILQDQDRYTLPLGLAPLVGPYDNEFGMLMAGTLLATLPIIAIFMLMQREFVSGMTLGAVKE